MTEETKTTELFECSQDMEVFLHGFFSGEVDLDKSLMKELSKLSTFLFEERRIYAESLAKERAVEFVIENTDYHTREYYEKAYDDYFAEKRKEGAECQHENAFPPFNDMKDKMKMYCPDCKQSF